MSTATVARPTAAAGLFRQRAIGVASGTLLAAVLWILETQVFGLQLLTRFGDDVPQSIGIVAVVSSSLAGALAGWWVLATLERRTARAREIWTSVAAIALAASLFFPLTAATTIAAKASLALMHLAVAAVIIPTFRRA